MSENVQIGPYQVMSKLGYGGMAVVYHAIDTRNERDIALKILLPQYYNDEAFLRRFSKESLNARRLHHPNIVKTLASGHDDGFHYIAMEYINGSTLEQYIAGRGTLTLIETVRVLAPIASGLDYAHDLGYVHRDLKLNNVMRSHEGRCYLTDFGVSKHLSTDMSMMTGIGQSIGTPSYMSPEQARGERIDDGKTDIYSFGVIAYRLLTGHLPFNASDPFELAHKIIFTEPMDPRMLNPYVDRAATLALGKALSKDPAERPESCREFVDMLCGLNEKKANGKTGFFTTKLFPAGRKFQRSAWLPGSRAAGKQADSGLDMPASQPSHRTNPHHNKTNPGTEPSWAQDARSQSSVQPSAGQPKPEVTVPGLRSPVAANGHENVSAQTAMMTELVTAPIHIQANELTQSIQMKPTRQQPYLPGNSEAAAGSAAPFVPGEPLPGQPPRPPRKRHTTVLTKGVKARPQPRPDKPWGETPMSAYQERTQQQAAFFANNQWADVGGAKRATEFAAAEESAGLGARLSRLVEPLMRRFRGGYNLD